MILYQTKKGSTIVRNYHIKQHKELYESTYRLVEITDNFLKSSISFDRMVDIGCGAGANTIYLKQHYPNATVHGIDKDSELLTLAEKFRRESMAEIVFLEKDIASLTDSSLEYDGIYSFQSISFLDMNPYKAVSILGRCAKKWISFSSLIYDGPIDSNIVINDFSDAKNPFISPYNILSKDRIFQILKELKYERIMYEPFRIASTLNFKDKGMGSTTKIVDGEKLLFSGPLYLPYGFIVACKA